MEIIIHDILKTSMSHASMPLLPSDVDALGRFQDRIKLLDAMTKKLPSAPELTKAILSNLHTNEISGPLKTFLNLNCSIFKRSSLDCSNSEICPITLLNKQRELAATICVLVLTAGMYSAPEDIARLRPRVATHFLSLNGRLCASSVDARCVTESLLASHQIISAPLAMLETSATPGMRMDSHDWRDKLFQELSRDAHRQHTGIVSIVGEICRDLERRCEGIEKPLKDEQARSQALEKEVNEAKERETAFEEILERKGDLIKGMEHEKESFELQLDAAFEKIQESDEKCTALQKDLHDERKGRKEDRKMAAIERDRIAGEHLGAMAENQARCDVLEEDVRRLTGVIESLRREIEAKKRDNTCLTGKIEEQSKELAEKQREIERRDKVLEDLGKSIEKKTDEVEEKNALVNEMTAKIALLEHTISENREIILEQRRATTEKDNAIETMREGIERLETASKAGEQKIHSLNQILSELEMAVAKSKANTKLLQTEVDSTREKSQQDLERLEMEKNHTVSRRLSPHLPLAKTFGSRRNRCISVLIKSQMRSAHNHYRSKKSRSRTRRSYLQCTLNCRRLETKRSMIERRCMLRFGHGREGWVGLVFYPSLRILRAVPYQHASDARYRPLNVLTV